jgi:hypothetical protein
MVTDQVSDQLLLFFGQSDQMVGFEDVITMFIMLDRIDKMPYIMQVRTNLQQEQGFAV